MADYGANLLVTLTETSVDAKNNTSKVNVLVQVYTWGGTFNLTGSTSGGAVTYKVNGGTSSTSLGNCTGLEVNKNTTTTLMSKTVTVAHKDDGTGSITVNVASYKVTSSTTATAVSKTLTLTSIPKSSALTFQSGTHYIGTNMGVTITRSKSSNTDTITYAVDRGDGVYGNEVTVVSNTSESTATINIPTSVITSYCKSATMKVKVYCYTYDDGALVGKGSYDLVFSLPTSMKPTISATATAIAKGATSSATTAITASGKNFQNNVAIQITNLTANNTANKSEIVSLEITGDFGVIPIPFTSGQSVSVSSFTTGRLAGKVGSNTYKIVATDARGMTGVVSKSVTLYAPTQVVIKDIKLTRGDYVNSVFTENAVSGTTIKFEYTVESVLNKSNIYFYRGKYDGNNYAYSVSNVTNGAKVYYIPDVSPDINSELTIRANDSMTAVNVTVAVTCGKPDINYNPETQGLAIGKLAAKPKGFEIASDWTVDMLGATVTDVAIAQGKDEATGWYYKQMSSGFCILWGIFEVSAAESSTDGSVHYSGDITMTTPFPVADAVVTGTAFGRHWIVNTDNSYANQNITFVLMRGATIASTVKVKLTVVGRWKALSTTGIMDPSQGGFNYSYANGVDF